MRRRAMEKLQQQLALIINTPHPVCSSRVRNFFVLMKSLQLIACLYFLCNFSAIGQDSSAVFIQELNGNFDFVRVVTRNATKLWRLNPAVAFQVKRDFFIGVEIPIIYLNSKSTSSNGLQTGAAPGGYQVWIDRATATNVGASIFIRKQIPLGTRTLLFFQPGFGHHLFYGSAAGHSARGAERMSERRTGFAPNLRVGFVYKLNERYWLNSSLHYSSANRLNSFVQVPPNAVSLQVGVTFLPRF